MSINNLPLTSNIVALTMQACQINDDDNYLIMGAKVAANTLINPILTVVALIEAVVMGFFYAASATKELFSSSASALKQMIKERLYTTPLPKRPRFLEQLANFAYHHKGKIAFVTTLGGALAFEHLNSYPLSSKIVEFVRPSLEAPNGICPVSPLLAQPQGFCPVPEGFYQMPDQQCSNSTLI